MRKSYILEVLLENFIWFLSLGVFLVLGVLTRGTLFKPSQMLFILYSATPLAFIVFAETICLLGGNFDLSVGRLTGLSAMATAVLITTYSFPAYAAIFIPVLIGVLGGIINGLLVGYMKLNPFLATLGTYMVFGGAMLMVKATSVWQGFPSAYLSIGGTDWLAILLTVIATGILSIIVYKTALGSQILSTGSSPDSAELIGIKTQRIIFYTYLFSGILCGIAAIFYTGYLGGVTPLTARAELFPAISAAVIGGISLDGGRGKIYNAFGGAILLAIVGSAITMLGLSSYAQDVAYGLIVIIAILVNWKREDILDRIKRDRIRD